MGLSPNFACNIKRGFKETDQQLLFLQRIPYFSNDFRKNKSLLILILEAKSGGDS